MEKYCIERTEIIAKAKVLLRSLFGERSKEKRPCEVSTKNEPKKPGKSPKRLLVVINKNNVATKGRIFFENPLFFVTESINFKISQIKTLKLSTKISLLSSFKEKNTVKMTKKKEASKETSRVLEILNPKKEITNSG